MAFLHYSFIIIIGKRRFYIEPGPVQISRQACAIVGLTTQRPDFPIQLLTKFTPLPRLSQK